MSPSRARPPTRSFRAGSSSYRSRLSRSRAAGSLSVACALLVGLAACAEGRSAGADAPGARAGTAPEGPAESLVAVLAQAEGARAGEAQPAVLHAAAGTGTVPVDAVRSAALRAVSCMREGGLDARYAESVLEPGILLPGWTVHHVAAEVDPDARVAACEEREHLWVSRAYQTQASIAAEHRTAALPSP